MIGLTFSCAGMSLFLGLIVTTEISRRVRELFAHARTGIFEHDTDVFPDHFDHPFPNLPQP